MATDEHFVIRCRGLPWNTSVQEVADFFASVEILGGNEGIHLTKNREGRMSGDAYIELASLKDVKDAMKLNNKTIGRRYIEVFEARWSEVEWMITKNVDRQGSDIPEQAGDFEAHDDNVVRCRGLPFEAGRPEIVRFFDGLDIPDNGILFTKDRSGRPSGQCYVAFTNKEAVDSALERNNKNLGHRYIEVFKSSAEEANMEARGLKGGNFGSMAFGSFGRGGGGGGPMMRGRGGFLGRAGPYDRMGGFGGRGGMMGGNNGPMGAGMGAPRPPLGCGYGRIPPPMPPNPMGMGMGMGFGGGAMGGGFGGGYSSSGFKGGFGRGGGMASSRMGNYSDDSLGGGFGGFNDGNPIMMTMRGLPWSAKLSDISQFFNGVADVVDAEIEYGPDGRPSGSAKVLFSSMSDAQRAMEKNKANMGSRYVELYIEGPV